jgi:very-short-patch-repair endonuclease
MPRDDAFRQKLIKHAREQRSNPTPAEKTLWGHLSRKQLGGLKFCRQHIIDPYIVDFYCHARKLVIEVDGGTHLQKSLYEKNREAYLRARGCKIIRFWNNEV